MYEEKSPSRTRPVRLTDIPLEIRSKAAREAAEKEDIATRQLLLSVALSPSSTTYWVRDERDVA